MKYKDLLIGFCIGIITSAIGVIAFLKLFTEYNPFTDILNLKQLGILGKVITLGTILNLIVFYILIQKNKDLMARGIILAMIVLTVFTLFL